MHEDVVAAVVAVEDEVVAGAARLVRARGDTRRGARRRGPSAATMSWPWWGWPARAAPKPLPAPPKLAGSGRGRRRRRWARELVRGGRGGWRGRGDAGGATGATTRRRRRPEARAERAAAAALGVDRVQAGEVATPGGSRRPSSPAGWSRRTPVRWRPRSRLVAERRPPVRTRSMRTSTDPERPDTW